jgi:hypothetical protein
MRSSATKAASSAHTNDVLLDGRREANRRELPHRVNATAVRGDIAGQPGTMPLRIARSSAHPRITTTALARTLAAAIAEIAANAEGRIEEFELIRNLALKRLLLDSIPCIRRYIAMYRQDCERS